MDLHHQNEHAIRVVTGKSNWPHVLLDLNPMEHSEEHMREALRPYVDRAELIEEEIVDTIAAHAEGHLIAIHRDDSPEFDLSGVWSRVLIDVTEPSSCSDIPIYGMVEVEFQDGMTWYRANIEFERIIGPIAIGDSVYAVYELEV